MDDIYPGFTIECYLFMFQIQFYLYVRCTIQWSKGEVLSAVGSFIFFVTKKKYRLSFQDAVEKISVIAQV
jgi:hypothetical protein